MTSSKISFKECSFTKDWKEAFPLMVKHYQELKVPGAGTNEFSPNIGLAKTLEANGNLICVKAVDEENTIVGYVGVCITPNHVFSNKKSASTLAFVVDKDYRRDGTGIKMMQYMEHLLKNKYQVAWFDIIMNNNLDISKWVERLGYVKAEVVYRKPLNIGD